ncbi:MAG: hypothetical protein B6I22_02305 [Desulfobacteraceae bacterium 4572_123]|nr:MAG: hypothetical protein B6I22_02305 [Desulfobacteraceae bacterium 4572_123]
MTEKNQLDQPSKGNQKPDDMNIDVPETPLDEPSDKEEIIDLTEFAAEESESDEEIRMPGWKKKLST